MFSVLARMSLVTRIIIAIILGIGVALVFPGVAPYLSLLGDLFIKALKSVAPVLVFVLVLASIANFKVGHSANLRPIIIMPWVCYWLLFQQLLSASLSQVLCS
jgi:serine/threonine transporter